MAKETKTLNTVIVESLTTIAKAANISTTKITFDDLVTLGLIDTTGSVSYDSREKAILTEATRNLFKHKNAGPLFNLLRIKNPEYSEEVIGNDFFQEKYREITGQGKTLLGYDHRVKALEQRFKPHVTTGQLRVMLDKQEVSPFDYMQLLASAARTEGMYRGTAQLREIFKSTQDELITGLFREPDKSKEIKFDEDRQQLLEKLGVDVERLKTTINGGFTESEFPEVADKAKYNMRYFDESLTDDGIERVAHAARATYTTIATPFFESAMGIRRLDPSSEVSTPVDMRTVSVKDSQLLGSFLALKPGETFKVSKDRIDSYATEISTAVDAAVSIIKSPEDRNKVASGKVTLGHRLAYQSVRDQLGEAQFGDINYVLKRDLADKLIETSGIATPSMSEFLRNALAQSMNPEFIQEHFGDYYLGETVNYRPVVDKEGNPTQLLGDDGQPILRNGRPVTHITEHTGEYQTMVFADNNAYAITLSTVMPTKERLARTRDDRGNIIEHIVFIPRAEGEALGDFTDTDLSTISTYINNNIDTRANLRGFSADNIKFGAANPLSKSIHDAYVEAQAYEIEGKEKQNKPDYLSEKPTKPVLYRDLNLYKQYLAEARQRLDKYVVAQGGPVLEGEPYIQERVIEQPDPDPDPIPPAEDDGKAWKVIETTRNLYSRAITNLQNAKEAIDTSNPEYKTTPEFNAYKKQDQFFTSCVESLSDNATEFLVGIFAAKHAAAQPEDAAEDAPEQPTIYGVMSDMFQNVCDLRKVKAVEEGTYTPQPGEVIPTKADLFEQRFALVGQLQSLGGAEKAGEILQSTVVPTAPEAN